MAQKQEHLRTTFSNTELETLHALVLEEFIPLVESKLGMKLYGEDGVKIKNHTAVLSHDSIIDVDVQLLIDTVQEDYLISLAKMYKSVPTEAINLRLPSVSMTNSNGSVKIVYGND